jgi:tRNA A-37 threonylcarbamoyl transferase component Bud32/tetratricopeptide (TPR) repeat protein
MEAGAVVDERFEVEGLARAGGMGSVFRARDLRTGERIALKIAHVHADAAAQDERFAREATVLAELRHPGIVRYVAHGRTETGALYLAMEWLDGEDVGQRLARAGMTVAEAIALVGRIAETLAAAHARGLVHRDLKPSNIFLERGEIGGAKVLDFGIVRIATDRERTTRTGMVLGTIGYMAPEQARGAHDVDARADVFALGCVLFECLTGRPPFTGRDVLAVQAKILLEEAPRVDEIREDVPAAVCDLVARMLAKDPSARPADAGALVRELEGIEKGTGAARPGTGSDRPPGVTTGERRLLSVVMVAPSRSAPRIVDTEPTLASDAHGGAILGMRETADSYGGRLEQLANGSVVVVLEATSAATDQAARAARCALALRTIAGDAPIALSTGRGDATARWPVGEVIERAVEVLRLSEARRDPAGDEPRPIDLDDLTAGLLDPRFDVRTEGARVRLHGQRDVRGPGRTLLGRPTPFVGRTRELSTLEAILDECIDESIAQAVLIEGPPGIGKTRLAQEFERIAGARGAEVWWSRGDPMSAGSPFGLIVQIVRVGAGLDPHDPPAVQRARLRTRLSRLFDPEGSAFGARELERITEFLGELLGLPTPGEPSLLLRGARQEPILLGDQMRRAVEDWIAAESARAPIVIVLEDLHWGDLPSVQFLDGALRPVDARRTLLVLALARPDVRSIFPTLWPERKVTRIGLGELTRKSSEKLVRHVLGERGAAEVARLVDQAAGNAFYLEELIRAAADGASGHEPPGALPRTVLAMIQARLEGLPAEARRVLRAASVFGQIFDRAGVAALLRDATKNEVALWLDELERRELIVRRGVGPAEGALALLHAGDGGDALYAFRHALVREAAYGMLVDRDREVAHRIAGELLEKRELARDASNEASRAAQAIALAEHFERGGLPERAAPWFRRAAELALEGNDFAAVVSWAARGLACGARVEILGPLRLLQAEGHRWRGELAQAIRHVKEALAVLSEDGPLWYAAAGELAVTASLHGDDDALIGIGERLVRARASDDLLGPQIVAWCRTATWLLTKGFGVPGEILLARAEEAATRLSAAEPAVSARLHYSQATRALVAGDTGAYLHLSEAAAIDFEHAGILRSLCVQRRNVAIARLQLGDPEGAEKELRAVVDESSRMGSGTLLAEAMHWLAVALARLGQWAEAQRVEERAIAAAEAHQARWIAARGRASLAAILIENGLSAEAEVQARSALEAARSSPGAHAYALATLSVVRRRQGATDEALASSLEAIQVLAEVGGLEDGEGFVRLARAEALAAAGQRSDAALVIDEARRRLLDRADKIGDPGLRRGFLQRVPEHARTLLLADEWRAWSEATEPS